MEFISSDEFTLPFLYCVEYIPIFISAGAFKIIISPNTKNIQQLLQR